MSLLNTLACLLLLLLLCTGLGTQDKSPDVTVTCFISEECLLPCIFQPGAEETVEWIRQDVLVYKFDRSGERNSHFLHESLDDRASVSPNLVSIGNATLILKRSNHRDRGTYRCRVRTATGNHTAKVILKMEAPIQGLFLELSRLSGYEEMKCTVCDVYPRPRVTWETEPPTFEELRPVTRILPNKNGLYTADSRLRTLNGRPNLIYVCKVVNIYGGPAWTASLREREIKGTQGRDLTIPCSVPSYLTSPSLLWTFSNSEDASSHILAYDSRSGHADSSSSWEGHAELDGFRIPFGDGSLRLMDPQGSEHTGRYTCVFFVPYGTHTEHSDVIIDGPTEQRSTSAAPAHWWVLGLVIGLLLLGLAAFMIYKNMKGRNSKPKPDPEEVTELHSVKDQVSPLAAGTNGQ